MQEQRIDQPTEGFDSWSGSIAGEARAFREVAEMQGCLDSNRMTIL